MKRLLSYYLPIMPQRYVYMLQLVEYDPAKLWSWLCKLPNLLTVMKRGRLQRTHKAQALLLVAYGTKAFCIATAAWFFGQARWWQAVVVVALIPLLVAIVLTSVVWIGYKLLYLKRRPLLAQTRAKLTAHPAVKVAILGSYGKTTMKELLLTILSAGKNVKATPGNMNVPISHARWVMSKVGQDEEVLIFEYGEGQPGDIRRFAELSQPDYAVITGLAPNHLDHYKSLQAVADDLLSIRRFVPDDRLLLNGDAAILREQAAGVPTYDTQQVGDWKISDVTVDYDGTRLTLTKGKATMKLHSALVGRHQVGPIAAAAALADDLGLTHLQISQGVAATAPFEHRMHVRPLHGAWIVDDTYNGNLEGIRAGLRLMQDLKAKRKVYVTPGLVDQGAETERVHTEIGRLIAAAKPDKVVLMRNSVTKYIQAGLDEGGYKGEVLLEDDPLNYYQNIEHTVAAGDLVVMQNDWTDNYL